ncbi:DNA-binding MarR family transcriptional regulator [Pseudoduganella lurida]|uniref:DNA-binding MarR family transcriptional regulator n=1 Tax=Pseudoduganella lurida TaxID=1036180 RepID=A0A562RKW9_9BURK|nr:MarR family transcriptional regulator [Pseudoduganella lurida]TWI69695.1 DNA-binding MarR family transcriptional regulator [Pseudoduganella lurida]
MTPRKPSVRATGIAEDLRGALKLLMREFRRDAERGDAGLSLMQTMLLATVLENPGIGVADLARLQNVRGPTISGQVKALEAAGLLERSAPVPPDRRRTGLQLTPAAHEHLQRIQKERLDWLAHRVARLDAAQLDALAAAIEPLTAIARP